jgi:capsule polysaccharide export protein KpsE/RkpR
MAEKHKVQRVERAHGFVSKLEEEIKEEEERLADFREGLQNITPGERKAAELKAHLEKLIEQTENKIKHKQEKLAEAQKQTSGKETAE